MDENRRYRTTDDEEFDRLQPFELKPKDGGGAVDVNYSDENYSIPQHLRDSYTPNYDNKIYAAPGYAPDRDRNAYDDDTGDFEEDDDEPDDRTGGFWLKCLAALAGGVVLAVVISLGLGHWLASRDTQNSVSSADKREMSGADYTEDAPLTEAEKTPTGDADNSYSANMEYIYTVSGYSDIDALAPGDRFYFGTPQKEWTVLAKEDGGLLCILSAPDIYTAYNDENASVTWKTCSLRHWLNEDYLQENFSTSDRALMTKRYLVNADNPQSGINGGYDTADKVFLLSADEALKYLYNVNVDFANSEFLRTPGVYRNYAATLEYGSVNYTGSVVDSSYSLVRPAIMLGGYGVSDAEQPVMTARNIKLGDYVKTGDIVWRCVGFDRITGYNADGQPIISAEDDIGEYRDGYLPLMIADKPVCEKMYDASGYNLDGSHARGGWDNNNKLIRPSDGSNYWGDSNIRTWLNSNASAGNIYWPCGNPPTVDNSYNNYNDYANDAGFLTWFGQSTLKMALPVQQKCLLNNMEYDQQNGVSNYYNFEVGEAYQLPCNYSDAYCEAQVDKFFLPDVMQIYNMYKNLGDYYCKCDGYYWTRTPYCNYPAVLILIGQDGGIYNYTANSTDDVRPCFYMDPDTEFEYQSGTASLPYLLSDNFTDQKK